MTELDCEVVAERRGASQTRLIGPEWISGSCYLFVHACPRLPELSGQFLMCSGSRGGIDILIGLADLEIYPPLILRGGLVEIMEPGTVLSLEVREAQPLEIPAEQVIS